MAEAEPRREGEEIEPTRVPLSGPNVVSTFDVPPHPDAVKVHDASIRKHLRESRPPKEPEQER